MNLPRPPEPSSPQQQTGLTETDLKHRSQELGLVGKIFGNRDHAPVNIAGAIVLLGFVAMFAVPFVPESTTLSRADMLKSLGGIVLASLTFLAGYLGGGGKHS